MSFEWREMKSLIKIFSCVCLLFSIFIIPDQVLSGNVTVGFTGGGEHSKNADFDISANFNSGGNKICALTIDIVYPSDLLELKGAPSLGSIFTLTTEQSRSAGKIHYQVGATGCSSESTTLLSLTFSPKASGSGTISYSAVEAFGGEMGDQLIAVTKDSASVTIPEEEAAIVEQTAQPQQEPEPTTSSSPPAVNKGSSTSKKSTAAPAAVSPVIKDPEITKISYSESVILDNEQKKVKGITFTGTATPDSKINTTIQSDPITASTQADSAGNWSYVLLDWLQDGIHKITVTAEKNNIKSKEISTDFVFSSTGKAQIAMGKELPVQAVAPVAEENFVEVSNENTSDLDLTNILIITGVAILLLVILLLIIFWIKRKNYLRVAHEVGQSINSRDTAVTQIPEPEIANPGLTNPSNEVQNELSTTSGQIYGVPINNPITPPAPIPDEDLIQRKFENIRAESGESIIKIEENSSLEKKYSDDHLKEEKPEGLDTINPINSPVSQDNQSDISQSSINQTGEHKNNEG